MAPSRYDWKIVDWDVKPQHNQPSFELLTSIVANFITACLSNYLLSSFDVLNLIAAYLIAVIL